MIANDSYYEYGTVLKVWHREKQLVISNNNESTTEVLSAIGVYRCKILKEYNPETGFADIEILQDTPNKSQEDSLVYEKKIFELKEKAIFLIGRLNNDRTSQNFNSYLNSEDNLCRLFYFMMFRLSFDYEQKIGMLSQNTILEKYNYLSHLIDVSVAREQQIGNLSPSLRFGSNPNTSLVLPKKYSEPNDQIDKDQTLVGFLPFPWDLTSQEDLYKIIKYLKENSKNLKLNSKVHKTISDETSKLMRSTGRGGPTSQSDNQAINYLETLLKMPWGVSTPDNTNLINARKILDEDHSSLIKVKKRVIEFLAIRALNDRPTGSILCLYGPPGVGKTSLGKSIARALSRKFERISLGGVTGQSALRGHRRTYIGSYCGQIAQAILRAGTENPVILLDEIDKLSGRSSDGDPSAAMLEVLDPNQNSSFVDHF